MPTVTLAATPAASSQPTTSPTSTPVASPSPTAGLNRYTNTELGYTIDLPAGWRRSACSAGVTATAPLTSHEWFFGGTEEEDVIAMGAPLIGLQVKAAQGSSALERLSELATQPDVRIEPASLNGRAGGRLFLVTTNETLAYAVEARGWIYRVERSFFGIPDPELERSLTTLRVLDAATLGSAPTPTSVPRSMDTVVNAIATAFLDKNARALGEVMAPCVTAGGIPGDAASYSRAAYVKELTAEFAASTAMRVSATVETDPYLGRFVRSTWSKAGEPDRRVDLALRADGERWSLWGIFFRAP